MGDILLVILVSIGLFCTGLAIKELIQGLIKYLKKSKKNAKRNR